ncbi:hypothetical protein L5515_016078 [Caenorhabditis briggsae]|uniref:Uncharacterized protein n=1 Tax=Caenorhabditis briggsae TaxID=6238 RepID=A0AAE9FB61_CAEBR|nr:hypothetical protein L5515_016078 [Caenorhabditis briggsae]
MPFAGRSRSPSPETPEVPRIRVPRAPPQFIGYEVINRQYLQFNPNPLDTEPNTVHVALLNEYHDYLLPRPRSRAEVEPVSFISILFLTTCIYMLYKEIMGIK